MEENKSVVEVVSKEEKGNQDYYPVIEPPKFLETMRKIQESDPVHADLINALIQQLLNNDRVLKEEKVEKTIQKNIILAASNWTGAVAPYSYVLELAEATETNHMEFLPPSNITVAQHESMIEADIIGGIQSIGSITLLAYGDKPTIDLPIVALIRGD